MVKYLLICLYGIWMIYSLILEIKRFIVRIYGNGIQIVNCWIIKKTYDRTAIQIIMMLHKMGENMTVYFIVWSFEVSELASW